MERDWQTGWFLIEGVFRQLLEDHPLFIRRLSKSASLCQSHPVDFRFCPASRNGGLTFSARVAGFQF